MGNENMEPTFAAGRDLAWRIMRAALKAVDPAEAVRNGLTAEAAVDRVRNEQRAKLNNARDAYMRERLHDLEDLANRLLRVLAGKNTTVRDIPDNSILVARDLGPADLLEYDRSRLKGILLEEGSAGSDRSRFLNRVGRWKRRRGRGRAGGFSHRVQCSAPVCPRP